MGIANCPQCGKVFVENPSGICPDCYAQEEKDTYLVGEYLRDHPKSHIQEVHEETGVAIKVIMRMIKKGRVIGDYDLSYPCESCGAPITHGRVCDTCSNKILGQLRAAEEKRHRETVPDRPEAKKNAGMFTTKFKP